VLRAFSHPPSCPPAGGSRLVFCCSTRHSTGCCMQTAPLSSSSLSWQPSAAAMEPVPETERMEEFKALPVPTLRLPESSLHDMRNGDGNVPWKLPAFRKATEPDLNSPRSPTVSPPAIPYRPRNTSPFNRGHLRSRSTTSPLAPPMSRAHSMPRVDAEGNLLIFPPQRSASPAGSPSRARRKPIDDVFPGSPYRGLKDISETGSSSSDGHTPRAPERSSSPLGLPYSTALPPRHRPSSPLRHGSQQSTPASALTPTTPNSATSSPLYQPSRFESFLGTNSYSGSSSYPGSFASSSVPSTPTSARSRSPSISSLETIPDSPDAEVAALEADRIAQLKAAADAADGAAEATVEIATPRGRALGLASRDKRKRWSVCGAERRGDLNLDTIWED
jgi:hypothetical protein